jgi:hypothetical protein
MAAPGADNAPFGPAATGATAQPAAPVPAQTNAAASGVSPSADIDNIQDPSATVPNVAGSLSGSVSVSDVVSEAAARVVDTMCAGCRTGGLLSAVCGSCSSRCHDHCLTRLYSPTHEKEMNICQNCRAEVLFDRLSFSPACCHRGTNPSPLRRDTLVSPC